MPKLRSARDRPSKRAQLLRSLRGTRQVTGDLAKTAERMEWRHARRKPRRRGKTDPSVSDSQVEAICQSCEGATMLRVTELDRAARPRCRHCGALWLDVAREDARTTMTRRKNRRAKEAG